MKTNKAIRMLALLVLAGAVACFAQANTATNVHWTAQNLGQLKKLFPNRQAVNNFVSGLYGDSIVKPTVGEYALTDLNGDGDIELVATLDFSGRAFYTTVLVVSQPDGRLRTAKVRTNGANVTDLSARIKDLRNDGSEQIILPRLLAAYAGATPVPMVPDVYAWQYGKLVRSDSDFPNYYTHHVLPRLKSALAALNRGYSSASHATTARLKVNYEREIKEIQENILGN